MDKKEYETIILHLQYIGSMMTENQLSKQCRDMLHNLQYNHMEYSSQKNAVLYLLLGAFLGIALTQGNYILTFFIGILTLGLMIRQNLSHNKKKKNFLILHKDAKAIRELAVSHVDMISNKIISGK